jgi:hypothetical protein
MSRRGQFAQGPLNIVTPVVKEFLVSGAATVTILRGAPTYKVIRIGGGSGTNTPNAGAGGDVHDDDVLATNGVINYVVGQGSFAGAAGGATSWTGAGGTCNGGAMPGPSLGGACPGGGFGGGEAGAGAGPNGCDGGGGGGGRAPTAPARNGKDAAFVGTLNVQAGDGGDGIVTRWGTFSGGGGGGGNTQGTGIATRGRGGIGGGGDGTINGTGANGVDGTGGGGGGSFGGGSSKGGNGKIIVVYDGTMMTITQ